MPKQDLSRHQSKIVKRYYENLDTIVATRLEELVSDLYLAEDDKKRARLWKAAKQQLDKTAVDPDQARKVIEANDPAGFAELVQKLVRGESGVLRRQ